MTTGEDRSITLQLKHSGDYKAICDIIERLHLRPCDEDWHQWEPNQWRQITFTFPTVEGAHFAREALREFLVR